MSLSIESIRAAHQVLPRKEVPVPDLGGSIFARALTLREVSDIQELQQKHKNSNTKVPAKVFELAACNEDGSPLFVGEDKKIIDLLPWSVIEAVSDASIELSGMGKGKSDDAGKD